MTSIANTQFVGTNLFDTNNILNMITSGYMINMMNDLKNSSFTVKKICILVCLLCVSDFKLFLMDTINCFKNKIPLALTIALTKLYVILKKIKRQKYNSAITMPITEDEKQISTNITVDVSTNAFMINALHNYITKNKNGTCTDKFIFKNKSTSDLLMSITYNNVNFRMDDDIHIVLNENFTVFYNLNNTVTD
jgi:hypothetical protein